MREKGRIGQVRTRLASREDWDAIWPVWQAVVVEGETCPWEPDTDEETARAVWMLPPPAEVLVMEEDVADDDGPAETVVVATALLTPSLPGLGDHVVQAMLLVDPKRITRSGPRGGFSQYDGDGAYVGPTYRWENVSRQAAEQMIDYAANCGYRAMQLNSVVAANPRMVALWRSLAFRVVGTLPAAFRHPWLGEADLHIMYRFLPSRDH